MTQTQVFWLAAGLLGLGATVLMDVWAGLKKRLWHSASLDYALVGRWLGHMRHGRFAHSSIQAASPIRFERGSGWGFHYLTGMAFAAVMLAFTGTGWIYDPTPGPALLTGLVTVLAPFFVMQPAFGLGLAASRTRQPGRARFHSVITHLVFGLGLYLTALLLRPLWPPAG